MRKGIACEIWGTHPAPTRIDKSHAEIRIKNGSPLQGITPVREHYTTWELV